MFHEAIEKIIVASFYGPRYIEGNMASKQNVWFQPITSRISETIQTGPRLIYYYITNRKSHNAL